MARVKNYANLEDAMVFALLMQNGQGIMTKAPDYVSAKWESIKAHPGDNLGILDEANQLLLADWRTRWGV